MQFTIFQESRRGARRSNQDRLAYCYSRDALLMLVADGMGGHLRGEMAAEIAAQFVAEAFRREARPRLADACAFLRESLLGAHREIVRSAAESGLPETPRTTCIVCIVQDGAAHWAHAGDSRLYHIRQGRILAQTKDHSLVQQLIDSGRMREESVAAHPERNRIFNCLGSQQPPRVDLCGPTALDAGDTLMLCSDGLWGPLSGKRIASALLQQGVMQAVPELLDEAERRAGRECDNLSVIAVTWEGNSPASRTAAAASGQSKDEPKMQSEYLSDEEIESAIARIRNAIKGQRDERS